MKNMNLLLRAESAWLGLADFRHTRRRNINYIYGDQWGDLVVDDDGKLVTERERIARHSGGVPLQNNHLIKIVHALTGLIAKRTTMPVCYARDEDADEKSRMMTNALQTNWEVNSMSELMVGQMEELMQGGISVVCEEWASCNGQDDAYTYSVNPDYFFFESKMNDPRLWDVSLIGEIRDYTRSELAMMLRDEPGVSLKDIYGAYAGSSLLPGAGQGTSRHEQMDFWHPSDDTLLRTYHVWRRTQRMRYRCIDRSDVAQPVFLVEESELPQIEAENRRRKECPIVVEPAFEELWHFSLMAPDGTVLRQFDSPYDHKDHPYTMTAYHFVNGKIYPFMNSVIDQQRYVNRLITLNDMYINSSIKGLKMIPKRSIPRNMTVDEFARQAVEVGGWIVYEPDPTGAKPEIITQNALNLGVSEMLQLQLSSINEITSVNASLQGVPPSGNTGYARYAMEMENSSTSVAALTGKFSEFERNIARKKMKVIHQYYQKPRLVASAREREYGNYLTYEPRLVADIDFKVSVQNAGDTPVARMMTNDLVMQMWQQKAISTEQLLQNLYLPGISGLRSLEEERAGNDD